MGFSRQEYWSGLPFPSPGEIKGNEAEVDIFLELHCFLCDPMDCSLPGSSVHGILQARIQEWVAMPCPPEGLPHTGIEPASPALQADSLWLSYHRLGKC